MALVKGKLVVISTKTKSDTGLRITFPTKKGMSLPTSIASGQLHLELVSQSPAQLNGLEVDLEIENGSPKRIRPVDKPWGNTQNQTSSGESPIQAGKEAKKDVYEMNLPQRKATSSSPNPQKEVNSNLLGDFHNPYNFIPAPPRDIDEIKNSELRDRLPCGHDSYKDNLWSGRISVTLTTVTPLLIPDAADITENNIGDKKYKIRVVNGKPYLPPTSIKGMLRSAYEAVTNSRFSIFIKHEDRLAFRMSTENNLIPAIVEVEHENSQLVLKLMESPEIVDNAARLLRYQETSNSPDKGESEEATQYDESEELPQHKDVVWVRLDRGIVTQIKKWTPNHPGDGWLKGWVYITGANISNKKYERVFIESNDCRKIIITNEIESLWRELITNYQKIHHKDLENRRKNNQHPWDYLGSNPGKTAWSRHVYDYSEVELKEGTLCYVEIEGDEIKALFPVGISRRLYKISPFNLLHDSLKPATEMDLLSPADRVFGWASQDGKGSYKGNLRINAVQCDSADPIEKFENNGFPLAILGEPKPQQARFYVAKNAQGMPLTNKTLKEDGYLTEYSLRGRKVYPHHANLPSQYWINPVEDRTQRVQEGHFQEYRRPKKTVGSGDQQRKVEQKDQQNRFIESWIKPNINFSFNIDITNLSGVELGALIWLLSLQEDNCDLYHRLGGGKPLGFGSVKLNINWTKTNIAKGEDWRKFYSSLDSTTNLSIEIVKTLVKDFKDDVAKVYGKGESFERVTFIQAFYCTCKGFDDKKPIHYPRIRTPQQKGENPVPPSPKGEGFRWFMENERTGNPSGLKVSLPVLWNETGLPYFDKK